MDSHTNTLIPPPITSRRSISPIVLWIFGLVVLALVIGGAYYAFEKYSSGVDKQVFVSFSTADLYTLDLSKKGAQAPQLLTLSSSQTKTLGPVLEAARGTKDVYYLIESADRTYANIYSGSATNSAAPLKQITPSKTLKTGLSYDPGSGSFAYLSHTAATSTLAFPDITYFDPSTGEERKIGEGNTVELMSGGLYALIRNQNQLIVVSTQTGKGQVVLPFDNTSPFAFDPKTNTLAIYYESAHEIQYFSLKSILSASYESSVPVTAMPSSMTYVSGTLWVAFAGKDSIQLEPAGATSPSAVVSYPASFGKDVHPVTLLPTYE
ncbi:MAG: hypothetical protein P4M11_00705 [Candidatus Pacebacteria bacterium]|nr:hypothetical protein [Candidatus Paceibacterota bacterium]